MGGIFSRDFARRPGYRYKWLCINKFRIRMYGAKSPSWRVFPARKVAICVSLSKHSPNTWRIFAECLICAASGAGKTRGASHSRIREFLREIVLVSWLNDYSTPFRGLACPENKGWGRFIIISRGLAARVLASRNDGSGINWTL